MGHSTLSNDVIQELCFAAKADHVFCARGMCSATSSTRKKQVSNRPPNQPYYFLPQVKVLTLPRPQMEANTALCKKFPHQQAEPRPHCKDPLANWEDNQAPGKTQKYDFLLATGHKLTLQLFHNLQEQDIVIHCGPLWAVHSFPARMICSSCLHLPL